MLFSFKQKSFIMAKNQTVRIAPKQLLEDNDSLLALEDITDYAPANQNFTLDIGNKAQENMQDLLKAEQQAVIALKSARDNAVAAEWNFHNYILGVKSQVIAQYGDSSNEIQALGLKKKTEYKSRSSKKTVPVEKAA